MLDRLEDWLFWAVTSLGASLAGAVAWLVRTVLTDSEAIRLLSKEIAHRDQLRSEDREAMEEIRASVNRVESVLLQKGSHREN